MGILEKIRRKRIRFIIWRWNLWHDEYCPKRIDDKEKQKVEDFFSKINTGTNDYWLCNS